MGYYINTIENNRHNQYKYQYLDHVVATINLRQNFWDFNMQLLMINNCSLPLNTLLMHTTIPYQEAKNLTFNLAPDQSKASSLVEYNKSYAKIYENSFSLDISNNQYLKQDLTNAKLPCEFKFEIDPEPIIKAKTEIKQEALDGLISETAQQRWSWEMYYTNTHLVNQSEVISNAYSYSLNNSNLALAKCRLINCVENNYALNETPIVSLIHFQSPTLFKIEEVKVKFYYWLDLETEQKVLETQLDVDKSYTNDILINFDKKTLFDYTNNKVVIDQGGVDGFYIPKHANGYYQLDIKLSQDNDSVKFVVKNNFTFSKNYDKPHISIGNATIKSLKGYKRLEF